MGKPPLEALLYMFGNVVAFALVGAAAFRSARVSFDLSTRHPVLWGSFHFIPVAAADRDAAAVAREAAAVERSVSEDL